MQKPNAYSFVVGIHDGKNHVENLGVDGKITFILIVFLFIYLLIYYLSIYLSPS